ncbi:hypothetical protein DL89DRAFT_281914 [Linderina pennispora]|uniref:Peptidase S1 domain-containing protein n=1 Tax=Linderina pennispora TaxID=61395 RepID=A0A1Y1WIG8_9FUNG|nr:uncharacterized protein DL89DRAFT_281914 [Linderina pennispora]ORX73329.1 hypothetical protein DL89DRAFT_281914 [Linderina pennispora]
MAQRTRFMFMSEKIDVHPSYDPDTFTNNVAIIQYNISSGMTWNLTLGVNVTEYADVYFIRRALKNLTTMEWYEPEVTSVKASDGQCSSWSNVFSNNKRDWMCNNRAVRSIYTEGCTVPYGTVYGAIDSKLTIAGIYSHSVVHGTDICGNSKQLHYYTMLASYFNWGKKVLGNVIRRGTKNRDIKVTVPADYAMRHPDSTTISGYSAIGGDLYFLQGVKNDSESDSLDFLSADFAIDLESALDLIGRGESKSISRGEIIAIAVCVPAGLIIIFLAVFFGLKWRKRRQASRSWDPQLETENLRTAALDIPGATSVYAEAPPRYESMYEHNSALAFPSAISEVMKGS